MPHYRTNVDAENPKTLHIKSIECLSIIFQIFECTGTQFAAVVAEMLEAVVVVIDLSVRITWEKWALS